MRRLPQFALVYLAALAALVIVDAGWLGLVAVGLYRSAVPDILRAEPWLSAAAAFYLVYAAGVVLLCVRPALRQDSARLAAGNGAVLGMTAYATFALTNLAVIKGWTVGLVIADSLWGTALTSISAYAAWSVGNWLGVPERHVGDTTSGAP